MDGAGVPVHWDSIRQGCSARRACPGHEPGGADCRTPLSARPDASWPTRPAGTARHWWSPTAGTRRRRPVITAGQCKTSDGPGVGNATAAVHRISGTTTPPSTLRATSQPRVIAPSSQSGPPSSVEPTVRPDLVRRVAVKRGREAVARSPNNSETGGASRVTTRDHSLATEPRTRPLPARSAPAAAVNKTWSAVWDAL